MTAAKKAAASDIPKDKLVRFYHQMVAIRLFEERVNDLYTRALMPGNSAFGCEVSSISREK